MSNVVEFEPLSHHKSKWLSSDYVDTVVVEPANKNSAWILPGQGDKHQNDEARGRHRDERAGQQLASSLFNAPHKPLLNSYLPSTAELPASHRGFERKTGTAPVAHHKVPAPFDQHFGVTPDGDLPTIAALHRRGALAEVEKGGLERDMIHTREAHMSRVFNLLER